MSRTPRQRSDAPISAAYMSLSTDRSPYKKFGMIFERRRSSTESRSSRLVLRMNLRCAIGKLRCAMQASN
jgi:hypothetical protein